MGYMNHFNDNLLCAIDLKLTGLESGEDDFYELAIVPLTYRFLPDTSGKYPLLHFKKRPINKEKFLNSVPKNKVTTILDGALDHYNSASLFIKWLENLQLGHNRKIMLLGWNVASYVPFLSNWIGEKHYKEYIHDYLRCVEAASLFCNDRSAAFGNIVPIQKNIRTYVLRQLNIIRESDDCLSMCQYLSLAYKKMVDLPIGHLREYPTKEEMERLHPNEQSIS